MAALFALPIKAQVNVGGDANPSSFSVLELTTSLKKGGLRLPQLSTTYRDNLFKTHADSVSVAAMGLMIYNTDTECLEFWNGNKWISLCSSIVIIPTGVAISPTEKTIPVLTTTPLTATVDPADASGVEYKWEYSFNQVDWFVVDGQNAKILNATALQVGDTWYRVTAFNSGGSATSNEARITGTMSFTGGGTNPNIQMYTGAFWRWREKGERIIQFGVGSSANGNTGNWSATVIWYDEHWDPYNSTNPDGVVLEKNSSALALPLADTNAENHPVVNGSQSISGSVLDGGTISFKIGLNKQFADSNTVAARYAVVLFSYNNGAKNYKLFIRQGEGADYVMRQSEPGTSMPNRPFAVKFSPYNLIDPTGHVPTTGVNDATKLVNGGNFTDFPTKAGSFLIFSNTFAVPADNPAGLIGAWNQNCGLNSNTLPYWVSSWETCPTGYRRPTDGPVNGSNQPTNTSAFGVGAVAGSEMRQSLWLNPPSNTTSNSDNAIWGYYADGYFDRRALQTSLGSTTTTNSAVATGSIDVAYIGKLFFNPNTNASLFFPGGGYRIWNTGALDYAGIRGRYWTSTSQSQGNGSSPSNAWFLYFYSDTTGTSTYMGTTDEISTASASSKTTGGLVRCVKNE